MLLGFQAIGVWGMCVLFYFQAAKDTAPRFNTVLCCADAEKCGA